MNSCEYSSDLLLDYIDGELAPADRCDVEEHLDRCPACRQTVSSLERSLAVVQEFWDRTAEQCTHPPFTARITRPPEKKPSAFVPELSWTAAAILVSLAAILGIRHLRDARQVADVPQIKVADARPQLPDEIERVILREVTAARLAECANILREEPGGEMYAQAARQYVARNFQDTAAGQAAASNILETEEIR
jgi:anti-sigma factor RsiW